MILYPDFNPVAFTVFGFAVYWYGICYLVGGTLAAVLLNYQQKLARYPGGHAKFNLALPTELSTLDLWCYLAVGIVLGGRLGYVIFYDTAALLTDFWTLFNIRTEGRSFHGGLIGAIIALYVYSWYVLKQPYLRVTDLVAPVAPIGLAFGRLGNFINGELWGRPTSMPWGMVFPQVDTVVRHPSQLYQMMLEGVVLFVLLHWWRRDRQLGFNSALFLAGYAVVRFIAEFFRQPDWHQGLVFGYFTKGQLLSLPMVLGAVLVWTLGRRLLIASND